MPGGKIAEDLGEYGVYAQELLLIGENEFSGLSEAALSLQAFDLAHRVAINGNKAFKQALGREIQAAEAAGDRAKVTELMKRYQAIIEAEA